MRSRNRLLFPVHIHSYTIIKCLSNHLSRFLTIQHHIDWLIFTSKYVFYYTHTLTQKQWQNLYVHNLHMKQRNETLICYQDTHTHTHIRRKRNTGPHFLSQFHSQVVSRRSLEKDDLFPGFEVDAWNNTFHSNYILKYITTFTTTTDDIRR